MTDPRAILVKAAILAVFAAGLLVARAYRRRWPPAEIAVMYLVGLLFEIVTGYMWNYHYIFIRYPSFLPVNLGGDISLLLPLGWAGWIMICTTLAEEIWDRYRLLSTWSRHLALSAVWLVIGAAGETLFYRMGMIEYVRNDATRVNFLLGQAPGLPPTMILVGYGLLQPFFSHYFRWLETSLCQHRQRWSSSARSCRGWRGDAFRIARAKTDRVRAGKAR
jgi:hypothetical protein